MIRLNKDIGVEAGVCVSLYYTNIILPVPSPASRKMITCNETHIQDDSVLYYIGSYGICEVVLTITYSLIVAVGYLAEWRRL